MLQLPRIHSAILQHTFRNRSRTCHTLAPDHRQSLEVWNGFQSFNRAAELWVGNSRGTNRNDFIRHELLEVHTWATLMALDQPEPRALLSKMVQHFFGVANDQMKSGGWVVMMEPNENPRHQISPNRCSAPQRQTPLPFS